MYMLINLGLSVVLLFMIGGLYGKLDEVKRSLNALRKSLSQQEGAAPAAAPPASE